MAIPLVINGTSYDYPETDDVEWGPDATDWAAAVTSGMLQKAGGLFQLLSDVDFGTTHGVVAVYYKTRTANIADAGQFRLASTDVINWRNQANSANLSLGINASDGLQFNGTDIQSAVTVSDTAKIDMTLVGSNISATIVPESLDDGDISPIAAIAFAKLAPLTSGNILVGNAGNVATSVAVTGDVTISNTGVTAIAPGVIVDADISGSAAIGYSKLNLTNSIVNADVNASAAIAYSKLNLTASIVNADISASAAIAFSKLAPLPSANILVGSVGNVATAVAMSGDVTISNAGVTAIGSNKISNAMLAQMAALTIKGNNTGGVANAADLTATQTTAMLNNFVGDSGAGGIKGLVPGPAAGDAASNKFLKADGTWTSPAGAGDVVGPAGSTDSGFAKFDGITGKLLKNSPATISNADIAASAAIDFSKLATLASANILVGSAGNIATSVAMTGDIGISNTGVTAIQAGVIVNADVNASAAIAVTKLAALTASRAVVSDGSGFISASATTSAEIGFVNGVTSAIQTQLDAKTLKATLTAKGSMYAATAASTPAELVVGTNGFMLVANSAQATGLEYKDIGATVQGTFVMAAWPIAAGQFGDLIPGGISLTAGTWLISFHVQSDNSGVVTTSSMTVGVGTTSGNTSTGVSTVTNAMEYVPISGTTTHSRSFDMANFLVTPGSTTTYYLKGFAGTSVANLRAGGRMTAVRIK